MHRLHGVHITDQHLVWADREQIYHVALGSEFRGCRIDIALSTRSLLMTHVKFIDCALHFKRQINNLSFCHVYLEKCQLKGRLFGCEFGRRVDDDPDNPLYYPEAGIVDTDLSAARLDGCRFISCDMSTIKLPRWPCFTVLDPEAVREQALKLPWPGKTYRIPEDWDEEPPGTVAVTDDARRICKSDGVTESELRAVVEQIPGVIM